MKLLANKYLFVHLAFLIIKKIPTFKSSFEKFWNVFNIFLPFFTFFHFWGHTILLAKYVLFHFLTWQPCFLSPPLCTQQRNDKRFFWYSLLRTFLDDDDSKCCSVYQDNSIFQILTLNNVYRQSIWAGIPNKVEKIEMVLIASSCMDIAGSLINYVKPNVVELLVKFLSTKAYVLCHKISVPSPPFSKGLTSLMNGPFEHVGPF